MREEVAMKIGLPESRVQVSQKHDHRDRICELKLILTIVPVNATKIEISQGN